MGGCGRKSLRFDTEREANQWIREHAGIIAFNGSVLMIRRAYPCRCGGWHVTSHWRRKTRK